MYLVIVYDINVDRVNNVHKFLKSHLHWQQNSVFEGKITKSQYNEIIKKLKDLIDNDQNYNGIEKTMKLEELKTILTQLKNQTNEMIVSGSGKMMDALVNLELFHHLTTCFVVVDVHHYQYLDVLKMAYTDLEDYIEI